MLSTAAQTDPAVPIDAYEHERWFRGTQSSDVLGGMNPISSVESEFDLVEHQDHALEDEQDILLVLSKQGKPIKIKRKSESGKRVLLYRGAYSSFESH